MPRQRARVIDFSGYVEKACEDGDGVWASGPSQTDVSRNAARLLPKCAIARSAERVSNMELYCTALAWNQFCRSRRDAYGSDFFRSDRCQYCKGELVVSTPDVLDSPFTDTTVRNCRSCGWWDTREDLPESLERGGETDSETATLSIRRSAVVREFDVAGSEAPLEALREHIRRLPGAVRHLSPTRLEQLVGSVFSEHMDCEATHIGGPNDRGIDLVLVSGARRYVVQVKRRTSRTGAEGVRGVREFVGAMVTEGELHGIYVTTAPKYSKSAQQLVAAARERRVVESIRLVSGRRLCEVLRMTTNVSPRPVLTTERHPIAIRNFHSVQWFGRHKFFELMLGASEWSIDVTSPQPDLNEATTWLKRNWM